MKKYTILTSKTQAEAKYPTRGNGDTSGGELRLLMEAYMNAQSAERRAETADKLAHAMNRQATVERHERDIAKCFRIVMNETQVGDIFAAREVRQLAGNVPAQALRVAMNRLIENGTLEDCGVRRVRAEGDWGSFTFRVLRRIK